MHGALGWDEFFAKNPKEWDNDDFVHALRIGILQGVLDTVRYPWIAMQNGTLDTQQVAYDAIHHSFFIDVICETVKRYTAFVVEVKAGVGFLLRFLI